MLMIIKQNRGRDWLESKKRLFTALQLAGLAGGVWLLVMLFSGDMGLVRYLALHDQARNLEQDLAALRVENATLRDDITRLQRDPAKIEQLAREQLGYVRKGETVYQVSPDSVKKPERLSKP